eukprot:2085574-Ditylum_brightwellii.AAC.1
MKCQKAESLHTESPCGIMDQYVSSGGKKGCALMIDCHLLDVWEGTAQKKKTETSAVVVCNSNVSHKEVPAVPVAAKKSCHCHRESMAIIILTVCAMLSLQNWSIPNKKETTYAFLSTIHTHTALKSMLDAMCE